MNTSSKVTNKEINKTLNVIKCFSIFCVIAIHCQVVRTGKVGLIIDALARFAVPIFFMISGYYSVMEESKMVQKYKARIFKMIKLIIISSAIYFVYYYISGPARDIGKWLAEKFTFEKIYTYIFFNESPVAGHLWFLNALLLCYILLYFLNKYNFKVRELYKYIPILLLCNIIIGELFTYNSLKTSFMCYRNFLFLGLPFFLFGYYTKDRLTEKLYDISNKQLFLIIIIGCLMTIVEVLTVNKLEMYIGTIFISMGLFLFAVKNPYMIKAKLLEYIGGKLYKWIYILHLLIIYVVRNYEEKAGITNENIRYLNTIIVFVIVVIIAPKGTPFFGAGNNKE